MISRKTQPKPNSLVTFPNGYSYKGEWKENEKNGRGTFKYANGESYEGEWKEDQRNGLGNQKYANGDIY